MNKNKHIAQKVDELFNKVSNPVPLKTSDSFIGDLNSRLDKIDEQTSSASVFTLPGILKYAAVLVIVALNVGAIITASFYDEGESTSMETLSDVTETYFPDYIYSELE